MSFKRYYNLIKNKHSDLKFSIGHNCNKGRKTIIADVYKDRSVTLV